MTRQRMLASAMLAAGVGPGHPANDYEMLFDQWLDFVVDDHCKATDAKFDDFKTDLVAGQELYCFPPAYHLQGCQVVLKSGKLRNLEMIGTYEMARIMPSYRIVTLAPGDPMYAVTEGRSAIRLVGPSNIDFAEGLIFQGYGTLATGWWAEDEDECPLPEHEHQTIVYALTTRICEHPSVRDYDSRRIFGARARYGAGHAESKNATLHETNRTRSGYEDAPDPQPHAVWQSGPLDL